MKKAAPLILVLCFLGPACAQKETGFTAEIIDGVKVVSNVLAGSKTLDRSLSFTEDLSLGGPAGATAEAPFFAPVDIAADAAGCIYVVDSGDAVVKKYDAAGTLLKTIGRKGQGPGEFERPTSLEFDANGRFIIADPSSMRITILSPDGIFEKSVLMQNYISSLTSGKNGLMIARYSRTDSLGDCVGSLDMETGRPADLTCQDGYWPARMQNKQLRYDFPYFVRCALDSKNRLYVGSAIAYEISVMSLEGRVELKFKLDRERIPVQGEMLEQISDIDPGQFAKFGVNPFIKDPYYPFFESLAIDERDRVWVQRYQPKWAGRTNRETPYDVFSPEGVFLFEARIPGHVASQIVFKNGFIYALRKTESGEYEAVRLKIRE